MIEKRFAVSDFMLRKVKEALCRFLALRYLDELLLKADHFACRFDSISLYDKAAFGKVTLSNSYVEQYFILSFWLVQNLYWIRKGFSPRRVA